ncbi:MAG: MBL fold metallo-hydrolase [Burkholderiales bacterium]|nr:MBL fold metallo-hydrolase [Burkholderiales bacterium]
MRVRFWGTRGSIPVSLTWRDLRDRIAQAIVAANGRALDTLEKAHAFTEAELPFSVAATYGGHSPCVELDTGAASYFVCDMGSGARPFGAHVMARQAGAPARINVFMSHLHWDHMMGFPFFVPAWTPGMRLRIHGCHPALEAAFERQQEPPGFPVGFSRLGADLEFVQLEPGRSVEVDGVRVTPKHQLHGGDSYGYRFEAGGRSVIYSTDSEHKLEDAAETHGFVDFFRDADLVIFDSMYSLAEAVSVKEDWGHSSNMVGVELCQQAGVRHLVLFHHEPAYDDGAIERVLIETRRFEELTREGAPLKVSSAYDGLEIVL